MSDYSERVNGATNERDVVEGCKRVSNDLRRSRAHRQSERGRRKPKDNATRRCGNETQRRGRPWASRGHGPWEVARATVPIWTWRRCRGSQREKLVGTQARVLLQITGREWLGRKESSHCGQWPAISQSRRPSPWAVSCIVEFHGDAWDQGHMQRRER